MRERRIVLVVGSQGSGKTTLAKALYGRAMTRGERVRVVDPNASLGGFFRADPLELEAYVTRAVEGKQTDLLVLDDADRYVPKTPRAQSVWRRLALTNRHLAVDVLLTARRLQNLPDELLSGVDFLYVFQLSSADVNGLRRLREVAPQVTVPTEPYRFVCVEPKTASGNVREGKTRPGGGFSLG